jgi:hypothetical protein
MFRLIFTRQTTDIEGDNIISHDQLIPEQFDTEAAAEEYAKPYIENGTAVSARILRPIAELTAVTTIQRRPVNG